MIMVTYVLLALLRADGVQALKWLKECVSLITSTAVMEVEKSRFLKALLDTASGTTINGVIIF